MPRRLGLFLVAPLAPLAYRLARRRRRIAERNIERCFPDWTADQRRKLVRESFDSLARMIVELAWCWSGPRNRIEGFSQVNGMQHIEAALAKGKGVLLVTGHFSCLEMGARILGRQLKHAGGVYRPLANPVMEWYLARGRRTFTQFMISKRNARQAVRVLRKGALLWYAPDQDFGPTQSVFAPFFNIQTASLLATHRLPKMTGCPVIPMFPRYDKKSGTYTVEILPVLENFPGDDPVTDLARINALIEARVREEPEQYWWIHRRFKTRPEGEPPFYD
jgi:KDO2-lipid IV(A) lauroyltransferase